jgi:hypothetical protein
MGPFLLRLLLAALGKGKGVEVEERTTMCEVWGESLNFKSPSFVK